MTQITRICVECGGSGFILVDCACVEAHISRAHAEKYGCSRCFDGKQSEVCPSCTDGKQSGWKKCEEYNPNQYKVCMTNCPVFKKVWDRASCAGNGLIPAADINDVDEWRK